MVQVRLEKCRICCVYILESSITSDDEWPRGAEMTHDRSKAINWGLGCKSCLRSNDLSIWGFQLVTVLICMHSLIILFAFMVEFSLFLIYEAHMCLRDTLLAWYLVKLFLNEIVVEIVIRFRRFFMVWRVLLFISLCLNLSAVGIFYQILRESIFNFLALKILVV